MLHIHTVALSRLFVVESLKYAYGKKESQPPSGKTGMLTKSGRMWFRALWRLEVNYENEKKLQKPQSFQEMATVGWVR